MVQSIINKFIFVILTSFLLMRDATQMQEFHKFFPDLNPACGTVPLINFIELLTSFHWSASHPGTWLTVPWTCHGLPPTIPTEANHFQGLRSKVQRNHS